MPRSDRVPFKPTVEMNMLLGKGKQLVVWTSVMIEPSQLGRVLLKLTGATRLLQTEETGTHF